MRLVHLAIGRAPWTRSEHASTLRVEEAAGPQPDVHFQRGTRSHPRPVWLLASQSGEERVSLPRRNAAGLRSVGQNWSDMPRGGPKTTQFLGDGATSTLYSAESRRLKRVRGDRTHEPQRAVSNLRRSQGAPFTLNRHRTGTGRAAALNVFEICHDLHATGAYDQTAQGQGTGQVTTVDVSAERGLVKTAAARRVSRAALLTFFLCSVEAVFVMR